MRLDRLRTGEWLNGASSVALIALLLLAPWFRVARASSGGGLSGVGATGDLRTGWAALSVTGPLILAACVLGISALCLTMARRSPVLPMGVIVVQVPVALAVVIAIALRLTVDLPSIGLGSGGTNPAIRVAWGGYAGLSLSLLMVVGVYLSLRREGVAPGDSPGAIEVLDVSGTPRATRA